MEWMVGVQLTVPEHGVLTCLCNQPSAAPADGACPLAMPSCATFVYDSSRTSVALVFSSLSTSTRRGFGTMRWPACCRRGHREDPSQGARRTVCSSWMEKCDPLTGLTADAYTNQGLVRVSVEPDWLRSPNGLYFFSNCLKERMLNAAFAT
eukprot:TRINITY_DN284_c0_g1_i2.p1 TRINITY_DN284_c0_g1~~TRINITY_DN284_c0_g1_i2.p1  ORF type:complete len:151 (-),score=2.89 TRINITY_DN284_c0_g1_i2:440-892(-)